MITKGVLPETLLNNLIEITRSNISFAQKKCGHLGENQLVWRATSLGWNVREVLSHLNSYASYYHPIFSRKIENPKFRTGKREFFVSSSLGRSAWKSMKLGKANNLKRKYRALKPYNPTLNPDLISPTAREDFISSQEELLNILEISKNVDLKKIKIPTSISKIIRLRLGDVLMFVVYHNERHIQQIKNILAHPKFPKKQ